MFLCARPDRPDRTQHRRSETMLVKKTRTVKITPGGQQVTVSFNLTMNGLSGVEIGRAPLATGHKTYAQQYGDFVNGSNGVPYAKSQELTINGLAQDHTYYASIHFQKGTQHFYKRNIPFTTKHRYVT